MKTETNILDRATVWQVVKYTPRGAFGVSGVLRKLDAASRCTAMQESDSDPQSDYRIRVHPWYFESEEKS